MASGYEPTVIDGRTCIWLQYVGWHAAKPLGEVAVGDVMVYNFGSTATVTAITRSKSGATVALTVENDSGSYTYKPRRVTTLVAVRGAAWLPS